MPNLVLESKWNAVTQLPRSTKVDFGAAGEGPSHIHPKELGNRTQFIKDAITPLANVAALKALNAGSLVALSPGEAIVRTVEGVGVFKYNASSTLPESVPFVIAPTSGAGRWHNVNAGFAPHAEVVELEPASPVIANYVSWSGTAFGTGELVGSGDANPIFLTLQPRHGARLVAVEMVMSTVGHTALPEVLPSILVYRKPFLSNDAEWLRAAGFQSFAPAPAVVADWNDTELRSWSFVCDQNNIIDRAGYLYQMTILDESGANAEAGNRYFRARLTYTAE